MTTLVHIVLFAIIMTTCDREEPELPASFIQAISDKKALTAPQATDANQVKAPTLDQFTRPKKKSSCDDVAPGTYQNDTVDCGAMVKGTETCYEEIKRVLSDEELETAPEEYNKQIQPFEDLCHDRNEHASQISPEEWSLLNDMWVCIQTLSNCTLKNVEDRVRDCTTSCPEPHCENL